MLRLICRWGAYWLLPAGWPTAKALLAEWERLHGPAAGEGHGPCDARTAARARWRADDEAAAAERSDP